MPRYAYRRFPYAPPPETRGAAGRRAPVAIVGAGPIGLALAIDLALHGVASVVLDDNDQVSHGSRAICWAKRTLEIFDRLGVGERMVEKGVTWKVGRLFHGARELCRFDLLPERGHNRPAFVNLQQYYVEQFLVERCADFPRLIDLRWRNRVTGVAQDDAGARLDVETPDGPYALAADWVVACDGAKSQVREMMGLAFEGRSFEDRFLIADVEMKADFPSERWFWFEPPFHPGQTALLHRQPDDIFRIDLQLGPDADPERETKPETVIPRIEKAVGGRPFELDWVSLYSFRCARLERFVHGRVIFAGDSAHVVSPFGARGGNGGIHDIDNLGWKLAAVASGEAAPALLESYCAERRRGADENIRHSSRATNFMSPRSPGERLFRDETLALAERHEFARRMVNSGRLSTPCALDGMSLQTPDDPEMRGPMRPGTPCADAPVTGGLSRWLLDHLGGRFTVMGVGVEPPETGMATLRVGLPGGLADAERHVAARYGRGVYLIRPDQHVAARYANADGDALLAARERALGAAPAEAAA